MPGMMTSGISGSDTMVSFTVTGVCNQAVSKTSNMTVSVPRSRMSAAMQNIHRMGGSITEISLGSPVAATSVESETES